MIGARVTIAIGGTLLLIAACGPETMPLPTVERTAEQLGCRGIGLDATLTGDPGDPRRAWLQDAVSQERIEIVWPAGYRARFDPAIEILDEGGQVVMTAGNQVTTACVIDGDVEAPLLIID